MDSLRQTIQLPLALEPQGIIEGAWTVGQFFLRVNNKNKK